MIEAAEMGPRPISD